MKPRKFFMGAKVKERKWYISAGGFGDGKSVCLWMQEGVVSTKIARFQSVESARMFIESFNFPISDRVQKLLEKKVME